VVTESTDADGDAITYSFAWDVDGVDYTGATDSAAESVVDGADVGSGQTWTCEVVASDGTESTGASTEVRVVDVCDIVYGSSSTYAFCADALTWSDAEAACVGRGGHLVTINNATEYAFIDGVVEGTSLGRGAVMWIGLNDSGTEGVWSWVSGETGYSVWASGDGYGGASEDCVVFDYLDDVYAGDAQGYRDVYCTATQPYVCEY